LSDEVHAIQHIETSASTIVIEAGADLSTGDAVAPQEALQEAEQITPVAEVVPEAVLEKGKES
jgi:hypothetical protein